MKKVRMTLALVGDEWSAAPPVALFPGSGLWYLLSERLGGSPSEPVRRTDNPLGPAGSRIPFKLPFSSWPVHYTD